MAENNLMIHATDSDENIRGQAERIREIVEALGQHGITTLDDQAAALGLCRSMTWTLRKENHTKSGLFASTINQMLAAPQLPPSSRAKIIQYVNEKVRGAYGHSKLQRRRFLFKLLLDNDLVFIACGACSVPCLHRGQCVLRLNTKAKAQETISASAI